MRATVLLRQSCIAFALTGAACVHEPGTAKAATQWSLHFERSLSESTLEAIGTIDVAAPVGRDSLLLAIGGGTGLILLGWGDGVGSPIAREGRGPGELLGAGWIVVLENGDLAVVDGTQHKLQIWSRSGRLRHDVRVDAPLITGAWHAGGDLVLRTSPSMSWMEFVRVETKSGSVSRPEGARWLSNSGSSSQSCRYCAASVRDDGLVALAVSDTTYRVLLRTLSGDSVGTIERAGVPAVRFSQNERDSIAGIWREMAQLTRARRGDALAARLEALARRPGKEFKPRFLARGILFGTDGMLYLQPTVEQGDSATVDVFDRDLRFVTAMRLPPGSVIQHATESYLLILEETESGLNTVKEYRMIRD